MHDDRARAESFGADPERYDRYRPRYPRSMVDDLLAGGTPRVLDVGCGTGIVADAFAAKGCDVLGVEPDARMAAVAERKGVPVEIATFEDWPDRGRLFDLVVSGQAWHWVQPAVGAGKAASVLRPGGRLALFWNLGRHDAAAQAALDEVYARHAPALLKDSMALGRLRGLRGTGDAEAINATGMFGEPRIRTYEWTQAYGAEEWVDQLPTHSDHRMLEPQVLRALLSDVAAAVDGLGGTLVVSYDTMLVTASRTAAAHRP